MNAIPIAGYQPSTFAATPRLKVHETLPADAMREAQAGAAVDVILTVESTVVATKTATGVAAAQSKPVNATVGIDPTVRVRSGFPHQ